VFRSVVVSAPVNTYKDSGSNPGIRIFDKNPNFWQNPEFSWNFKKHQIFMKFQKKSNFHEISKKIKFSWNFKKNQNFHEILKKFKFSLNFEKIQIFMKFRKKFKFSWNFEILYPHRVLLAKFGIRYSNGLFPANLEILYLKIYF
jgi:hypothetical protein